jgi:hypothetical protein
MQHWLLEAVSSFLLNELWVYCRSDLSFCYKFDLPPKFVTLSCPFLDELGLSSCWLLFPWRLCSSGASGVVALLVLCYYCASDVVVLLVFCLALTQIWCRRELPNHYFTRSISVSHGTSDGTDLVSQGTSRSLLITTLSVSHGTSDGTDLVSQGTSRSQPQLSV